MKVIGPGSGAVLIVLLQITGPAAAQPALRWKLSRPLPVISEVGPAAGLSPHSQSVARTSGGRTHLVIQFAAEPTAEQWTALEKQGVMFLESVPDFGYLVSAPAEADLRGCGLVGAGALEAGDKLSKELSQGPATVIAEFHKDIDAAQARAAALGEGLELMENPDLAPQHLLVRGTRDRWLALAAHDEFAYLYPAAPELLDASAVLACAGALAGGPAALSASNLTATFGEGWDGKGQGSAQLTYWLGAMAPELNAEQVRAEIRRALGDWSAVVKIDFAAAEAARRTRGIDVFFASGEHGDGYPFDGRGKVLAHTYYPPPNAEPLAGDLHLDADELWRIGVDYDVYSVTLHELGHALGLGHSDDPNAVMYPYYRRAAGLRPADVAAIKTLYAARERSDSSGPPVSAPGPDTTSPSMSITSPGFATITVSGETIIVRGTAWDNTRVAQVTYSAYSGSGLCSGTTDWATPPIKLYVGTNLITIRAKDDAGNMSWRAVYVTRR
jgi:hypothetical protein